MKSLYIIACGCCVATILLTSGCELTTPDTTGNRSIVRGNDLLITEVFSIAPEKYYAYSWVELYNPTTKPIKWFDQTKPASGYAVGGGGTILHTNDDGEHWTDTLSDPHSPARALNCISFSNAEVGYVVGENNAVLKINKNVVTDISANVTGAAVGKTLRSIAAVSDASARTAFVCGDGGTILRTTNGGTTWIAPSQRTPPIPNKNFRSIFLRSLTNSYIVGDSGTVLVTSNLGILWSPQNVPEPVRTLNFYSINVVADTAGWITGEQGTILFSRNAGGLWVAESSGVNTTLRDGFFSPADPGNPFFNDFQRQLGWVVGDNGVILKTTNNGTSWFHLSSGTTARLNSVQFVDSLRGWVYGDNGVIRVTTNGGTTWSSQSSTTSQNVNGSLFQPFTEVVQNFYELDMLGKRNHVFFDPTTGSFNFDFITSSDTGIIPYVPGGWNFNVRIGPNGIPSFTFEFSPDFITLFPGQFLVMNNDSLRFKDHTGFGPGDFKSRNFGLATDTNGMSVSFLPKFYKWNLLSSSELRLVKVFQRHSAQSPFGPIGTPSRKVIDVVRFGGYRPSPLDYPNNKPQGAIPEWYSMARYNDKLNVDLSLGDLSTESTLDEFYMAKVPIPGYYSLLSSPKK